MKKTGWMFECQLKDHLYMLKCNELSDTSLMNYFPTTEKKLVSRFNCHCDKYKKYQKNCKAVKISVEIKKVEGV